MPIRRIDKIAALAAPMLDLDTTLHTDTQALLEELVLQLNECAVALKEYTNIFDECEYELIRQSRVNLLYKARVKVRLPGKPKISKSWTVKPTIRARLPKH